MHLIKIFVNVLHHKPQYIYKNLLVPNWLMDCYVIICRALYYSSYYKLLYFSGYKFMANDVASSNQSLENK